MRVISEQMAKDYNVALYIGMFVAALQDEGILSAEDAEKVYRFGHTIADEAQEIRSKEYKKDME